MKAKIAITAILILGASHAYAQGVKLSSFPISTAIDTNISLVGVHDNLDGSYTDYRYPFSLLGSLYSLITFDVVLNNGNTTSQTAVFSDGSNTVQANPTGVFAHSGSGFLNSMSPANSFVKDGSNKIWFAGGDLSGRPSVYIKDAGSSNGDTIDIAATSVARRVTIQNNNRIHDTIPTKTYVDSLLAIAGGTQTLDVILGNGNITNKAAKFGSSTDTTVITAGHISTYDKATGQLITRIGDNGGTRTVMIGAAANTGNVELTYVGTIVDLTAWMPNYGALEDTIVTRIALLRELGNITGNIVASGDKTNQSTLSTNNLISYLVPATSTYNISCYLNINSISGGCQGIMSLSFTNENSTVINENLAYIAGSGLLNFAPAVGYYSFVNVTVRAKIGTTITIAAQTNSAGSINYDAGTAVQKLY